MKRIFVFILGVFAASLSFAQSDIGNSSNRIDSMLVKIEGDIQETNSWLQYIGLKISHENRYKLYPTENIYTFLQLDTKTGRIEQVQWSLDEDEEGTMTINDIDLTFGDSPGNFELYPTQNMYQFILLDKTDGRKLHVQWGIGEKKRWIRRIY